MKSALYIVRLLAFIAAVFASASSSAQGVQTDVSAIYVSNTGERQVLLTLTDLKMSLNGQGFRDDKLTSDALKSIREALKDLRKKGNGKLHLEVTGSDPALTREKSREQATKVGRLLEEVLVREKLVPTGGIEIRIQDRKSPTR